MENIDSRELAWKVRRHVVDMAHNARASHIGGALSCADILAVLYSDIVRVNPLEPEWPERDRVVLSKGHNGMALYATLAECGFFPIDELKKYGQNGSKYSCHVSHKGVVGVELSTGSLGHGVCVACGMALAAKLTGKQYRVFAIVGDGECNEGSIWEMALLAHQYRLDNFTVIVDRNHMQAMGRCEDVMDMEPFAIKWNAFGWHVVEVADGHDHCQLKETLSDISVDRPRVIICNTIKGKGVSFMENQLLWHYRDPQGEFYDKAVCEIEAQKQ